MIPLFNTGGMFLTLIRNILLGSEGLVVTSLYAFYEILFYPLRREIIKQARPESSRTNLMQPILKSTSSILFPFSSSERLTAGLTRPCMRFCLVFMWLSNRLQSIFKLEQLPRCKNRIVPPILRVEGRFQIEEKSRNSALRFWGKLERGESWCLLWWVAPVTADGWGDSLAGNDGYWDGQCDQSAGQSRPGTT